MVNLHIIPMKDLFFTLSSEIIEVEQSKLFSQNDIENHLQNFYQNN